MLAGFRRLGSGRLHLLAEHGRMQALLSEALASVRIANIALVQSILPRNSRSFASTQGALPEQEEVELTLPDDLSAIARLNPQLRDVVLAHQQHARASARGALRERLQQLLAAHDPGLAGANITKTSLARLRVDELRAQLEEENGDTRGNKDALVQRLLALVRERERVAGEVLPAMDDFEEGVVTRRQVSQQEKRQRRRQQHHTTYGISEQAFAEAQAAVAVEKTDFATIFQPEQVAGMLLEARAADVCVIDVRARCPFADYFVLATARSQRMVGMLAGGVLHRLKALCREVAPGVQPSIEGGKDDSEWQVVDAGSVVVHIFLEGYRDEYDLEGLWAAPDRSNITYLEPKQTVNTLHTIR